MTDTGDLWHRWLLDEQHGDDTAYRERMLIESLYPVRTEVLDNAQPGPGDTLLDSSPMFHRKGLIAAAMQSAPKRCVIGAVSSGRPLIR